ncbi:MAG: hypothetical protein J6K31_02495 [Parabacteroides sp.]|nr:hypothetical protein [Parabacteroides sp.]
MNENRSKRISQKIKCRETQVNGLLEKAETFARRVLESIQALAGTTACKGVQIARLKEWAIDNGCWVDSINELGTFVDRGSENEVYMSKIDNKLVYKLNDFRYSDDNLSPFFFRLKAQQILFPDCSYTFMGFSINRNGKICALLTQQYVISEREATEDEIHNEFLKLGFHPEMNGEYYTNGKYDIFDASPNNVLVGIDGNLYFIDTIIYKSNEVNLSVYKSQSPKYSTNG